jgi:hypothetical protein
MRVLKSLTVWVTPFTALGSLAEAIDTVHQLAAGLGTGWAPSLLLPTHFGQWPQAQCRQSLPSDMRVGSADDVAAIRAAVESAALGFGAWGVPVDLTSTDLAAGIAAASGYYSANFEPDAFWRLGDSPADVDVWWSKFWNALPDQEALSGNVSATVVPNPWGLGAFRNSLPNLAAGCGALVLETYGGLQTAGSYPAPNLWPSDGFAEVRATGVQANLYPILARANLSGQIALANRLGHGNVHVWAI